MDSSALATVLETLPGSSRPLRSWVTYARALPQDKLSEMLEKLPQVELDRLKAELIAAGGLALEPRTNRYLEAYRRREPRFPSGPQRAFLCLDHVEHVLYGGAAGGGKSSAGLAAALQYVDVPGYAAVIFRATYQDLQRPDALIPRSHEWLAGTGARWDGKNMTWHFPERSTLSFGYLEDPRAHLAHQGAAYQCVDYDEAGQLRPAQMDYLTSRTRRLRDSEVPIRIRYQANPGDRAHDWLVAKFMVAREGLFVPALALDNPGLDVTDYVARLAKIKDPILRDQLLKGDWKAVDRSGLVVPEWTEAVEESVTASGLAAVRPPYFTPYVSVDTGSKDLTVYLFGYLDFVGGYLVVEDELVFRDPNTREMGDAVGAKEAALWGPARTAQRTDGTVRCADGDGRYLRDLAEPPYRLQFSRTEKFDAEHFRRACRADLVMGKISIHPRCRHLIRTLKHARKKENGDFERSKELGHADAWAALAYMHRNVDWGRNPFPEMVLSERRPGTYVEAPRQHINFPNAAATLAKKYMR